jgi:hypothetical protein
MWQGNFITVTRHILRVLFGVWQESVQQNIDSLKLLIDSEQAISFTWISA